MIIVIAILVALAAGLVAQARHHARHLARIPVRIHVNGSRGKSSVTRLIAAGLRAGGVRTIAKTTGTKPRFIYTDGSEVPVVRAGSPNIIEQIRIVRRAAQLGAQALVVECMAVKPELQSLLEDRIIRSTHGVITNVRADHLDEMGPTLPDVARNLARTIPHGGRFFTAEHEYLEVLRDVAALRGTTVEVSVEETVDDETIARFPYIEHPENVALALAVCGSFGVEREVALQGMVSANPDPGAMRVYRIEEPRGEIIFVNGFAANDPDSYVIAWERVRPHMPAAHVLLALVVCRPDRMERSFQLGEMLRERLAADHCLVTGPETGPFLRAYGRNARAAAINLQGASAADVFESVRALSGDRPLVVFGIGNIVGLGEEIVAQFSERVARLPGASADTLTMKHEVGYV